MARRKRVKIVVSGKGYTEGWKVKVNGKLWETEFTKADAIEDARDEANRIAFEGGLAQVVVKNRNGRIATEWTYGADPRRFKG